MKLYVRIRQFVVGIFLICLPLHAQEPTRACDGLLKHGLHNVARAYRTEEIEKVAHKKHCSKSDSGYSFSDKAEFMWFFAATASPNFDAKTGAQWCKENASRLEQSSTNFLEVLTFSQEALGAFNHCISLQKENVLADALIENDTLIVYAWRNSGRESYLQRFDFDAAVLDCSGTGRDEAGKPSKLVLDEPIKLVQDFKVNIVCRRKAKSTGEPGVRSVLPRTTVALTTDLSTPLAITLMEQKDLEPSTVADLRAEFRAAVASVAEPQVILPWLPFDWEGRPRAIPQGWAICDGNQQYGQRFANLQGRFLMGSTKEEGAGSIGGATGYNWRDARYQGDPERRYLHATTNSPDLRPPWYSVVFLCRVK